MLSPLGQNHIAQKIGNEINVLKFHVYSRVKRLNVVPPQA